MTSAATAVPFAHRDAVPLILIADDHEDTRDIYAMALRLDGYECVCASNGLEGLRLAREHRPAVIIMDAAMPCMDGWEATAHIRADPLLRRIPVLMVSGHGREEHIRRAAEVGATRFLTKPLLPDDLVRAVVNALRQAG